MSALAKALLAFQKEAPDLHKDSKAVVPTKSGGKYEYRYLGLDGAMEKIRPLLTKHGLVLIQLPTVLDGKPALRTKLMHESGEAEEDTMLVLGAADPQGQGSALTYARRYSIMAVLGLVADEDDDATAAQPKRNGPAKAGEPPAQADEPEPENRPTNAQHRKLAAVLKELETTRPSNPDVPRSGWEYVARDWIENQFQKKSRTQLTKGEMALLIDAMEKRLEEEKAFPHA
jgi:hypothetical protein